LYSLIAEARSTIQKKCVWSGIDPGLVKFLQKMIPETWLIPDTGR